MDEKKEEVKQNKETKATIQADAQADKGAGDESTPLLNAVNAGAERAEKAVAELKAENDRAEAIEARRRLGGTTDARREPEKPKELTDTEYAEALQRGEVNPLKDDGFIK